MSIFKKSLLSTGALASILVMTYSFDDADQNTAEWAQTSTITCDESVCVESITFPAMHIKVLHTKP